MSIIAITHHDENIVKISEKDQILGFDGRITTKARNRKKSHFTQVPKKPYATMGLPEENPPDPCDYLKKNTGRLAYNLNEPLPRLKNTEKKGNTIPSKEEVLTYDKKRKQYECHQLKKNFIANNIKTVLRMKPKEPERRVVLEPTGTSKNLSEGLEPVYIRSDVFGKTPAYLKSFIKQREKLYQMQKDASGVEKPKCRYVRRDEREELLRGLKHNWEELQHVYQGLPILTDTIPKINRKAKIEAELKQLEKDIVLVERHPYIYVYDENIV